MGLVVFAVVLLLVALYFVSVFNRLVSLKNQFTNAFSQIDVQLQRRYELIPNLVESAKAYMAHEKDTLSQVIEARNQAVSAEKALAAAIGHAEGMNRLAEAEGVLGSALGRLMAVAENYPDLKADQTMLTLMEELASTDNRVSFARQAFNDAVMHYNIFRERFPHFFVAGAFGFMPAAQLPISNAEARQPVRVSFN